MNCNTCVYSFRGVRGVQFAINGIFCCVQLHFFFNYKNCICFYFLCGFKKNKIILKFKGNLSIFLVFLVVKY